MDIQTLFVQPDSLFLLKSKKKGLSMQWAWIRNFSALLALLGEIYCNALEGSLSGQASLLAYFRTISSRSKSDKSFPTNLFPLANLDEVLRCGCTLTLHSSKKGAHCILHPAHCAVHNGHYVEIPSCTLPTTHRNVHNTLYRAACKMLHC